MRFGHAFALALGLWIAGMAGIHRPTEAQEPRRSPTGVIALEVNGAPGGLLGGANGGDIRSDVIMEAPTSGYFVKKHIGAPKFDDLTLDVGPGMEKPIYDWIAASWQGKSGTMNGALLLCDYNFQVIHRKEFTGTLAETTIPALNAGGKEPAHVTLTVRPEMTKLVKGAGTVTSKLGAGAQKAWLPSNFRVEISGLDCSRVSKIDAFTVKMSHGKVEFPNLRITLAETTSQSWNAWLQSFVVGGLSDDSQEKNGEIVFLAPDRQTELGRVSLYNLGIATLQHNNVGAASDHVKTATAELYCERMAFNWTGGGTSSAEVLKIRTLSR